MDPSFFVPAEYFYALAADLPALVTPETRYRMATLEDERQVRDLLRAAIDRGIISAPTDAAEFEPPEITAEQAARRLRALGGVAGFPEVDVPLATPPAPPPTPPSPDVRLLVEHWLAYNNPALPEDPAADIAGFWATVTEALNPPLARGHVRLALAVITQRPNVEDLLARIADVLRVAPQTVQQFLEGFSVEDLALITSAQWTLIFTGNEDLLPDYTLPGSFDERVSAFIRHLRRFFDTSSASDSFSPDPTQGPPTLGVPSGDPLRALLNAYLSVPHALGDEIDFGDLQAALADVFPDDARARARLEAAFRALNELFIATDIVLPPYLSSPEPLNLPAAQFRFSLMEALYARGFTSRSSIQALAESDFLDALVGTVAYDYAGAIQTRAGDSSASGGERQDTPRAINPNGGLVNCVPPEHRSPLGPVAYLQELLRLSSFSTCAVPFLSETQTLSDLISARRGPLASLQVARANLETPLPLIDLVNECLEAKLAGSSGGVVHQTNATTLAGHTLSPALPSPGRIAHDPATLFAALPEHSTPETPTAAPFPYDPLRADFSAPSLPYSQPLDACRSHLQALHSSRFEVMRRFRHRITEFVLAPDPGGTPAEPAEFRSHLWRLPLRVEIAREYLGISAEEATSLFGADFPDETSEGLDLRQLYGIPTSANDSWPSSALALSSFLAATGLRYCELLDLLRTGWAGVQFSNGEVAVTPPECEPCCLDDFVLRSGPSSNDRVTLRRLAVFIRLWRKLQLLPGARYTFSELADIAQVFELFYPDDAPAQLRGKINPDFLRQLAAFQLLRDQLALPLVDVCDEPPAGGPALTGASRTHLLALWVARGTQAARKRNWAIAELLERLRHWAHDHHHHRHLRPPEFLKLLADNLDPLSRLAGFDVAPATTTWDRHPTHTLRFVEVLGKLCASHFSIGELFFLFTAEPQLAGDDPFPLASRNESRESPLDLPDDERMFSLWELRCKLLEAHVSEEEQGCLSWVQIQAFLRRDFGFVSSGPDPLQAFAEHFFPCVLGHVDPVKRQYRVPLVGTPPLMWNTPPGGPFRYDEAMSELCAELPLRDEAVIRKLSRIKSLSNEERRAVQDLYFAPRTELANLAFLFPNLNEAEARLIEEPDELARWRYFQHAFALALARCRIIAEHLAAHVSSVTGSPNREGHVLAWKLLQHLLADENKATSGIWELASGDRPEVTWLPADPARAGAPPIGSAFAALLGLVGTGLLGEIRALGSEDRLLFRELQGPLDAFGEARNRFNAPFPTVLPELTFELSAAQLRFVGIRNGFAFDNDDADRLGGAQGFSITWRGVLLVEESGSYEFQAGAPTPDCEPPSLDGGACQCWKVTLGQGQRSWVVLSHEGAGKEAHSLRATPITLKRGAYDLTISFQQRSPVFDRDDVKPARTGFQLKYTGPDTGHRLVAIPARQLYIAFKDLAHPTLDDGLSWPVQGTIAAREFLRRLYTSSLRDIRRTYQRAFKALLFAQRMGLSAKPISDSAQTEIGYMLEPEHRADFAGQAFELVGSVYQPRPAYLDFNLLPVGDDYFVPAASDDQRVAPTLPRQQALFDWWERLFDYTALRSAARAVPEAPAWLLFHEAAENHPDDPAQLLRYLGVDLSHSTARTGTPGLVLRYYDGPGVSFDIPTVRSEEFEDEQWAIRVWRADQLLRGVLAHFTVLDVREAQPNLWASNDPGLEGGNENLARFVREGLIENGEPVRYEDLKRLNDGLRERGRGALAAYLTALDRLQDPTGEPVRRVEQLSELFLIDVAAGLCQRASRIEEAVSAVQTFVQRARLGLEPSFSPGLDFNLLYDRRFATFQLWQACKRSELYRENRIEVELLEEARQSESYRFLEDQLRRSTLTVAAPAGLTAWSGPRPPAHPGLALLQAREPSVLRGLPAPKPGLVGREGFTLVGVPERDARPSWLATTPVSLGAEQPSLTTNKLPYWIESAIRLGARFVRVAAAGLPMGAASYDGPSSDAQQGCCAECGVIHAPGVDEYYFWLSDSRHFTSRRQDADISSVLGAPGDDVTGGGVGPWHDPGQLPRLLAWESEPMVHLFWARVHNGELGQPRRSHEGVQIDPSGGQTPELVFLGRLGDSLHFRVLAGVRPVGHVVADPDDETLKPGFRYDLATDRAEVLPPAVAEAGLPPAQPGGLPAYPHFVLFEAGAPLIPPSFFSQALTIAGALRSHCRFEAALAWYGQSFDPLHGDAAWCPPVEIGDGVRFLPACCRGGAVPRDQAERRAITLSYLETLLDWADATLRRHSPEAFEQARVILDAAARILGAAPRQVQDEPGDTTLGVGDFDFELVSPPLNPRLLALYERVNDRRALVHGCQSARRRALGRAKRDMPYFGDVRVRNGWESSAAPCLDDNEWCAPACAYRFVFLLQKASELAAEVRGLGTALLAAYQNGDAEYLASLRATHERQLLELTTTIRQNQWRESDWQVQALYKAKEGAQTRIAYFQALIARGLIGGESSYRDLTIAAAASRTAGNVSQAIGQVMNLIPDLYLGFPCNQVQPPVGSKLANVFSAIATIANTVADILSSTAGLRLTEAGWQRREDDWRHQVDVITVELEQIERQINAAERRRDIALRELNNYQRQLEQSTEVLDFLRDKFTNHQLFLWLQRETSALHQQAFNLAFQVARQAERAFNYERGHQARRFLDGELWSDLHEGLLAGDRLGLALKTMEKAYLDDNHREYELTKHVSLRQLLPLQLLRLRVTGVCEIELPEWLFDLDYPGHYMRRIRNVSLSIPSVIGPFSGVHCRLTLLSSATRVDPRLGVPVSVCCEQSAPEPHPHACPCCGHVLSPAPRRPKAARSIQSGYSPVPDDPRIVVQAGSLEAIATSSAQNDTGLFELNFRDERYLPFEFAGAVSRFRLELPPENNYFDLATVSDVILHLNYTAREGGAALRTAAAELARARLPDAGERVIDVKLELPDVWHRFSVLPEDSRRELELCLDRELFPFLPGQPALSVQRVEVLLEVAAACPGDAPAVHALELVLPERSGCRHDAACEGPVRLLSCVRSERWPDLYDGVASVSLEPIRESGESSRLKLVVPGSVGQITRLFVVLGYEVTGHRARHSTARVVC